MLTNEKVAGGAYSLKENDLHEATFIAADTSLPPRPPPPKSTEKPAPVGLPPKPEFTGLPAPKSDKKPGTASAPPIRQGPFFPQVPTSPVPTTGSGPFQPDACRATLESTGFTLTDIPTKFGPFAGSGPPKRWKVRVIGELVVSLL